jgi:hypothetical protein
VCSWALIRAINPPTAVKSLVLVCVGFVDICFLVLVEPWKQLDSECEVAVSARQRRETDPFVFDHYHLFFFSFKTGVWTQGFSLAKKALYSLSHSSRPFCSGCFKDGVSETICPGGPQTEILPISASQVARITGMRHRCPVITTILPWSCSLWPLSLDLQHFLVSPILTLVPSVSTWNGYEPEDNQVMAP